MTRCRRYWPLWRWILTGLIALALALSAYLGWHYLAGGSVLGCDGGSPCDQVLGSPWSTIGGILPVSGLAAGAYLAMLVASLFIGPATTAPTQRLAWSAMLILVGAAAGSAVWFTIVQKWVIRAFCPYCMATHIAGLLLTALVMWRVPRQFDDDTTDFAQTMAAVETAKGSAPRSNRGPLPAFGLAVVGVALAGILAASQVAIKPRGVYRGGDSRIVLPALDPHAVPIVGSPDAPYVVTLLFDYKCPHCQHLHFLLAEAIRRYGGKLAFVLCPAPLSRQCNPYIPRDVDEFKDSCELAKIGLAVWLAKREAFPAFDGWMFSMESGERWEPRSLDAANAKAIELAGRTKFDAARANPWIDQYLQTSIRVYSQTLQSGTGVPKFVFGSRWVLPKPFDADDLVSVLHDSLGLPNP